MQREKLAKISVKNDKNFTNAVNKSVTGKGGGVLKFCTTSSILRAELGYLSCDRSCSPVVEAIEARVQGLESVEKFPATENMGFETCGPNEAMVVSGKPAVNSYTVDSRSSYGLGCIVVKV